MTRDPAPHDGPMTPEERLRALVGDGLDGQPSTPEEEAAARLTAHALGELSPAEAAEIQRRLDAPAADADRAAVAATRALAEALRRPAAKHQPPREPVGSPSLRTAVTAALAAGGGKAAPRPRPAEARSWPVLPLLLGAGSAAAALVALVVAWDGRVEVVPPMGRTVVPVPPAVSTARREAPGDAPQTAVDGLASASDKALPEALQDALPAAAPEAPIRLGSQSRPVADGEAPDAGVSPPPVAISGASLDAAPLAAAKKMEASDADRSLLPSGGPPGGPLGSGLAAGPAGALPLAQANGVDGLAASSPDVGGARSRGMMPPPGGMLPPAAPAAGEGLPRRTMAFGARAGGGLDAGGDDGREAPAFSGALTEGELLARARGRESGLVAGGAGGAPARENAEGQGQWFHERDLEGRALDRSTPGTERYARFVENPFRDPSEKDQALSTFSIDVDTASYALVRRFIHDRRLPPPDAVRLEEMLNYFRYDDAPPAGDDPLAVRLESASCPWQPGHRLLRVALKGRDIAAAARPGTSLVFLVDVSGSMNEPNKLPLVKQALSMLVDQLTENDTVAIVTYAGDAGVRLPPTSGDQKGRIRDAVESLRAGGSTNGSAGIEIAYRLAQEAFVKGGSNRVLLATDGDLNVGITDDATLVGLIKEKAGSGVFLTVLGFGQGNLQDEKMEKLADNGNGIYAYIDGAREARKVLVEQLTGSTLTIAKDVKIQIEFNPARVAAYRLLGYENRILAARDFKDDTKDAGDVGAGHGVTALYEIVPADGDGAGAEDVPLKYQPSAPRKAPRPAAEAGSPELCTVHLRWKAPEASESVERETPFEDRGGSFEEASADLRFAAAVAEFGMLLRESRHRGRASLNHVTTTAAGALANDPGGLRAEFLDLVREAGALVPHGARGTPN